MYVDKIRPMAKVIAEERELRDKYLTRTYAVDLDGKQHQTAYGSLKSVGHNSTASKDLYSTKHRMSSRAAAKSDQSHYGL